MNNIKAQELINSNEFVREPVDKLCKRILNNSSRKIILQGERGVGKSTVLYNLENKKVGDENQIICSHFDSCTPFSKNPNEKFDEKFFEHYYEYSLSIELLLYIKRFYSYTYENSFKDIELLLKEISKNTVDFINNIYFINNVKLKRYLNFGEISLKIIERQKKLLEINKLSLAIDRFDWINDSSSYTQNLLSKYFELFDKIILTTDDLMIKNQNEIENKDYSFITVKYGKELNIIKEIIKRRIKLNNYKYFNEEIITDEIYNKLIEKSNGNISLMLETIFEVAETCEWEEKIPEDLSYQFEYEINNQIMKKEKIKKMNSNSPRIYLK